MRENLYGTQTGVYSRIPGPRNLARHPAPNNRAGLGLLQKSKIRNKCKSFIQDFVWGGESERS